MNMSRLITLVFSLYLGITTSKSQMVFYQDVFNGGVTGAGFSTGQGWGAGNFDIHVEPGSNIKKAFMFVYSQRYPTSANYILNNTTISFDTIGAIMNVDYNQPPTWYVTPSRLYYRDVTDYIDPSMTTFEVTIPAQFELEINEGFWAMYLLVLYENPLLSEISCTVLINDKNLIGNEQYSVTNLNPINVNFPTGFSLFTDRTGNGFAPDQFVYFNSINLGKIGGSDAVNSQWLFAGVKGHFYYQNNELFGLDDDTPDNIMGGTDGLANVSEYIINGASICDFQLLNQSFPNVLPNQINNNLAYFLTYNSPCQPFNAALLTSDTTTCAFVPVQLGASGGNTSGAFQAYEWLPQHNLSCYDCPNPVFTGNASTNYTVRIRNSDSCSVVYPVRVRVLPNPSFESIEITESVCGGATGSIAVASSGLSQPHSYVINDGAPQDGTFNNLAAGAYTVTVSNADGCSVDSTIVIGEFNNVMAAFSVNPLTGAAPLDISITNQSQNATAYFWDFSNQDGALIYEGSGSLSGVEAPLAGVYTLTLVAGNGTPHCNDTTSLQIFVYDSLQVVIPNVFTPNNDGTNDWFGITSNIPISGKIVLLNRWGNVVQEKSFNTQANLFEPLWNGMDASEGVYFYRIFEIRGEAGEGLVLDKETEFQGFVHLVR